jgi:hypothetical protein
VQTAVNLYGTYKRFSRLYGEFAIGRLVNWLSMEFPSKQAIIKLQDVFSGLTHGSLYSSIGITWGFTACGSFPGRGKRFFSTLQNLD